MANFTTEIAHGNIARQWFAPHETLALLPVVGKNVSLVWSLSTEKADELLDLAHADLSRALADANQASAGTLNPLGKTLSFSIKPANRDQFNC